MKTHAAEARRQPALLEPLGEPEPARRREGRDHVGLRRRAPRAPRRPPRCARARRLRRWRRPRRRRSGGRRASRARGLRCGRWRRAWARRGKRTGSGGCGRAPWTRRVCASPRRAASAASRWRRACSSAVGSIAEGVKNTAFNVFLLFYYNQVLGVSGTLTGTAIFLALCVDAVADPLIGSLSDGWRSRLGRRHPFMYAAALPMAVCFALLFLPAGRALGTRSRRLAARLRGGSARLDDAVRAAEQRDGARADFGLRRAYGARRLALPVRLARRHRHLAGRLPRVLRQPRRARWKAHRLALCGLRPRLRGQRGDRDPRERRRHPPGDPDARPGDGGPPLQPRALRRRAARGAGDRLLPDADRRGALRGGGRRLLRRGRPLREHLLLGVQLGPERGARVRAGAGA